MDFKWGRNASVITAPRDYVVSPNGGASSITYGYYRRNSETWTVIRPTESANFSFFFFFIQKSHEERLRGIGRESKRNRALNRSVVKTQRHMYALEWWKREGITIAPIRSSFPFYPCISAPNKIFSLFFKRDRMLSLPFFDIYVEPIIDRDNSFDYDYKNCSFSTLIESASVRLIFDFPNG